MLISKSAREKLRHCILSGGKMKKRLFAAVTVAALASLLLSGCATEPEKSKTELSALLLPPSEVASDATLSNLESDFAMFIFTDGVGEYPGCAKSAKVFKKVSALPIVAATSVNIDSDSAVGFNEWILDAKSKQTADELVASLSKDFYPDSCAENIFDNSSNQSLSSIMNEEHPGHIWFHAGGFGSVYMRTFACTQNGRYLMFVDTTSRMDDMSTPTFTPEIAGSSMRAAVKLFTAE
jgi:hypothetical protein